MPTAVGGWITFLTPLSVFVGGLFAAFKWLDQRKRETQDKRFDQNWKLIEISQESPFLAKQKVALLLLKKVPEYSDETVEFLSAIKALGGDWSKGNSEEIEAVLHHFGVKGGV